MELPKQLKIHRERLGLSQEEVAKRIFVSRQTMSSWETGKTYPDVQSLLLLSNLFDVSIDELVKGDVEVIKNNVRKDSETLRRLSWAMLAFTVAAIVAGGFAVILRDVGGPSSYGTSFYGMIPYGMSISSLIAIVLVGAFLLCAFAAAVWAEVLKRQNDIVTYREIAAFEQGIPVEDVRDNGSFGRKHPILSIILKVCFGAAVALVACIFFTALAKAIRDFIFTGLV